MARVYKRCPGCTKWMKRIYIREGKNSAFVPSGMACKACRISFFDIEKRGDVHG